MVDLKVERIDILATDPARTVVPLKNDKRMDVYRNCSLRPRAPGTIARLAQVGRSLRVLYNPPTSAYIAIHLLLIRQRRTIRGVLTPPVRIDSIPLLVVQARTRLAHRLDAVWATLVLVELRASKDPAALTALLSLRVLRHAGYYR